MFIDAGERARWLCSMGAEEGPRAPNEPPTPQPRTEEILSLMAFFIFECVGWCSIWLHHDGELPKHGHFSASQKYPNVCLCSWVILFLGAWFLRGSGSNLDSDVKDLLKIIKKDTLADGFSRRQPYVNFLPLFVCCTQSPNMYTLIIIITMFYLTRVVLCLTPLMTC